jgi:hypothetical protein
MKKFEIRLMTGDILNQEAVFYNIDIDNNLDMLILDDEGMEEIIATFKNWDYIRVVT